MKSRISFVIFLFAILVGFNSSCKIVSFDKQTFFVTITLEELFDLQSGNTSYMEMGTVDLGGEFSDVELADVVGITIVDIQVTIIENNTSATTSTSGNVYFNNLTTPLGTDVLLASFSNININANLNNPLNFANNLLNINALGVAALETQANQTPPPELKFVVSGAVNNPPVDLVVNVLVTFQLELAP